MATNPTRRNALPDNALPDNALLRPEVPIVHTATGPRYGTIPPVTLKDGTPYPPLTLEKALATRVFHVNGSFNADGSCVRYRVNGTTKTWKRAPERFSIPIKHGLRDYAYITPDNLYTVHAVDDCPFMFHNIYPDADYDDNNKEDN